MYCVYALYSPGYNKIYIGFTSDVQARLKSHNSPINKKGTSSFQPWELIYTEHRSTKQDAMIREKQLKSFSGREFIRTLIKKQ